MNEKPNSMDEKKHTRAEGKIRKSQNKVLSKLYIQQYNICTAPRSAKILQIRLLVFQGRISHVTTHIKA
jgi:hypothetical protein